ncbi:MAG: hypothetical protein AB7F59_09645 [Bdellovibrionales bacterium]
MRRRRRIKRIGRFWVDRILLDEGYGVRDIFEINLQNIEVDSYRFETLGWLQCPECEQQSQVELRKPICGACGWCEEDDKFKSDVLCAA